MCKNKFLGIFITGLTIGSMLMTGCTTPSKQILEVEEDQDQYQFYMPIILSAKEESTPFSSFGPDGGTVVSIEIDPENPNVVYAGTWGNGIYRSPDRGVTWFHHSQGFVSGFVFDMEIDPLNSNNILASAYQHGVYISRDAGQNWIKTIGMPAETVVYAFAYDPSDTDIVYAAVREKTIYQPEAHYPGGIYRSIDGGLSWVKMSTGLPDDYVYDVLVDPNNVNIVYAGLHKTGVYKSTNGGKNWFSVNNNIHYRDVRSLDINPLNGFLYAGLYDGRGVAFTRDGGATWSKIDSSITQSLYVYSLALNPQNFETLYLTGPDGIFRCSGNPYPTETSACRRTAFAGEYVFSVALDPTSSIVYTGLQDASLFKSTDGGTSFQPSYAGIKANVIPSVINDPENPAVFYVSALGQGLFKSSDNGSSWTMLTNGVPAGNVNGLVFRPGNTDVIYAATQTEGIFLSANAGASWTAINQGLSALSLDEVDEKGGLLDEGFEHPAYAWMDPVDVENMRIPVELIVSKDRATFPEILSIGIDPSNPARMMVGTDGYGILKSNDFGSTWSATGMNSGSIYDFLTDNSQGTYLYFAGVLDSGVRKSDAFRQDWTISNTGFHAGADVFGLASQASGAYVAASDRGVYKSTDAALTWTNIGLSDIPLTDVFVDPNRTNIIFASSLNGLIRSNDSGQSWEPVGYPLLNDRFLTITQGYGNDSVFFGMSGGNIYRFNP
jgi:photosystem II stability/assembly factor-like uncharacterized protein